MLEIVFDPQQDSRRSAATGVSPAQDDAVAARAGDSVPAEPPNSPVQRSTNRISISLESGVSWQRLTAQPDHDVDFLYLRCTRPHRFATIGDETVEAVWFVVGRGNTRSVDDSSVGP
jgi:hypothetical protein